MGRTDVVEAIEPESAVAEQVDGQCPELSRDSGSLVPRRVHLALAVVLLVVFGALFLAHGLSTIVAPFGPSHDGENAGVWALGSRAIREAGWIASGAGGHLAAHQATYAHHPPLIFSETALLETVFGPHEWVTRAPAWLGSIASIGLLFVWLRRRGLRPLAAATGTIVAFASPMFMQYGTMLDTLQIGLPFMLGVLVVRESHGRHRELMCAVFAAFCVLASWEGALVCVVLCVIDGVHARGRPRSTAGLPVGTAVGLVLLAGWFLWVSGGIGDLVDQFTRRSGNGGSFGWSEFLSMQRVYLRTMLSPIVVAFGIVGMGFAIADRRTREVALVLIGTCCAYAVGLRDGAIHHDYWNYWLIVPAAIGLAVMFDRGLRYLEDRDVRVVGLVVCVVVCSIAAIGAMSSANPAAGGFEAGKGAGEQARELSAHQERIVLVGVTSDPVSWAAYYGDRSPLILRRGQEAKRYALAHPEAHVLVSCRFVPGWLEPLCDPDSHDAYREVRAKALTVMHAPSVSTTDWTPRSSAA